MEKEPRNVQTVQEYVDGWTKMLTSSFYRELRDTGELSDEEADKIVDKAAQRAEELWFEDMYSKLKEALTQTELPFPRRHS